MNPFKKRNDRNEQILILDTCALIDGRIIDIAKAGFVPQNIVIPQFIIAELQYLADHGDSHKRERARHGLDVIRDLQDLRRTNISIAREQFKNIKEVDDKLIALAKQYGGMLYTTDYNLNKVAQIEGVVVLNVNELAQALRPRRLPGERIELKITQVGQDKTQGVGYLEDGTMVVVERAASKVGQRILVEFSRMLQTQAGKMMFAVLPERGGHKLLVDKPAKKELAVVDNKITHLPKIKHPKPQQQSQAQSKQASSTQTQILAQDQNQKASQKPTRRRYHKPVQKPMTTGNASVAASGVRSQQQNRNKRTTPEDSLLAAIQRRNDDAAL